MIDGEEGKEKRNGEKLKRNPSSFEISSPITPRGWGGGGGAGIQAGTVGLKLT